MAAHDLGFVTQEQVYKFLGRQVEEVVLAVLMRATGCSRSSTGSTRGGCRRAR
jgi:hypothetical protein